MGDHIPLPMLPRSWCLVTGLPPSGRTGELTTLTSCANERHGDVARSSEPPGWRLALAIGDVSEAR